MMLFAAVRSAGMTSLAATSSAARTVALKGLEVQIKGSEYSPELPEWMMGWPIGWTASEPLEMDKFQQWLRMRGAYSQPAQPDHAH